MVNRFFGVTVKRNWIVSFVFVIAMFCAQAAMACPSGVSGIAGPNKTVCAEAASGELYCNVADSSGNFYVPGSVVPPSTGGCLPFDSYWFYQLECYGDGMRVNRRLPSEVDGGPWLDVSCRPVTVHQPRICLLGTDWDTASGHMSHLWDVDPATGAVSNPRSTGLRQVIGIAMHPSNTALYAVTTFGASPANSLFRIDIATGASTWIGPLGIGSIYEGDLAFGDDGTLYGIQGSKLYKINTSTGAATLVGNPLGQDYSFLSFNGSNKMFAIDNGSVAGAATNYLKELNKTTAGVVTSQPLSMTLGGYGGMDWNQLGGHMWVADGQDPGGYYPPNRKLFRLDTGSGALTVVGPLGLSHGLTGLASCKPCAVETALVAVANQPEEIGFAQTLGMAYRVRDELLQKTRVGRHYIDRFYDHSLRMVYLMATDESLRLETADFLVSMAPGFFDLLDHQGHNVTVTRGMIDAAGNLAGRFAEADGSGGSLTLAIDEELNRVDLDLLDGLTFADAWAYLNTLVTGELPAQN